VPAEEGELHSGLVHWVQRPGTGPIPVGPDAPWQGTQATLAHVDRSMGSDLVTKRRQSRGAPYAHAKLNSCGCGGVPGRIAALAIEGRSSDHRGDGRRSSRPQGCVCVSRIPCPPAWPHAGGTSVGRRPSLRGSAFLQAAHPRFGHRVAAARLRQDVLPGVGSSGYSFISSRISSARSKRASSRTSSGGTSGWS
jgi:hypothetical protein